MGAGFQYIAITVNSTTGVRDVYTHELLLGRMSIVMQCASKHNLFFLHTEIECAQLTEPGATTLVCAARPVFVRTGCSFPSPSLRLVPCKTILYKINQLMLATTRVQLCFVSYAYLHALNATGIRVDPTMQHNIYWHFVMVSSSSW